MLKKYFTYIKESVISNIIKPDPSGLNKILNNQKTYRGEFQNKFNIAYKKIRKEISEIMIETMKKDLVGRLISIKNVKGCTKIIDVKDIILGNDGDEFYPVIFENDNKKCRYLYENNDRSTIFFLDDFMTFFKNNYLNNILVFNGKSMKGIETRFTKHIIDISYNQINENDQVLVEDDKKNKYVLYYTLPIKILDMRVKELDPYGEENWEN